MRLHLEISVYIMFIGQFHDLQMRSNIVACQHFEFSLKIVLFTAINWPSLWLRGNRACKCNLFGWFQLRDGKPVQWGVCMAIQIN